MGLFCIAFILLYINPMKEADRVQHETRTLNMCLRRKNNCNVGNRHMALIEG